MYSPLDFTKSLKACKQPEPAQFLFLVVEIGPFVHKMVILAPLFKIAAVRYSESEDCTTGHTKLTFEFKLHITAFHSVDPVTVGYFTHKMCRTQLPVDY